VWGRSDPSWGRSEHSFGAGAAILYRSIYRYLPLIYQPCLQLHPLQDITSPFMFRVLASSEGFLIQFILPPIYWIVYNVSPHII